MASINWKKEIQPLLKKYKDTKHPLNYNNNYELLVAVILSAQDSDRNINKIAPVLFETFPDVQSLAKADFDSLFPFVQKVRSSRKKTNWLLEIAQTIKKDKDIPATLDELVKLPGIGRKSANVIKREAGWEPEGIIVDLHVVRVAPRIGLATGTDPKKIEKQLMELFEPNDYDAGMAISFLGREICRPTNPKCLDCVMKKVCVYTKTL